MHAVPLALTIGGGLLKAAGQARAGSANRELAYGQAREEEAAGAARELRIRAEARKAIGEQVAAQASNGFLGDTGSPLEALAESQVNAVLDAMTVRREAAMRARSLRAEGNQARAMGRMGAIETLIGTGAQGLGIGSDWAAARAPYRGTAYGG